MSGTCPDCGKDAFAGDVYCRQCGRSLPSGDQVQAGNVVLHKGEEPNTRLLESILYGIEDTLAEQQRQTQVLDKMNQVIQLWGLLLILSVGGGACIWIASLLGWVS